MHLPHRALVILSLSIADGGSSNRPLHQRTASASERRVFATIRPNLAWELGGSADDTTFLLPFSVVSTTRHIVVYDAMARRVVALDPRTGRKAWAFGRAGSGPGEFGGVAFVSARQTGGVLVLDHANQRVTLLSESGSALSHRSYPLGASATGVCELDSSQIRLSMAADREIERVNADSTRAVSPLPWPELKGQPSLVRQSHIFSHARGDVCLLSLTFGPRFALLDRKGTRALGTWIEEVPLAKAMPIGKGSWTMARGSRISTTSVTGVGGAFAVLFEGTGLGKARVIDFYSANDARYLLSVRLPYAARTIAYGHELLVVAGETPDGAPFVRALRTAPSLRTLVEGAGVAN